MYPSVIITIVVSDHAHRERDISLRRHRAIFIIEESDIQIIAGNPGTGNPYQDPKDIFLGGLVHSCTNEGVRLNGDPEILYFQQDCKNMTYLR